MDDDDNNNHNNGYHASVAARFSHPRKRGRRTYGERDRTSNGPEAVYSTSRYQPTEQLTYHTSARPAPTTATSHPNTTLEQNQRQTRTSRRSTVEINTNHNLHQPTHPSPIAWNNISEVLKQLEQLVQWLDGLGLTSYEQVVVTKVLNIDNYRDLPTIKQDLANGHCQPLSAKGQQQLLRGIEFIQEYLPSTDNPVRDFPWDTFHALHPDTHTSTQHQDSDPLSHNNNSNGNNAPMTGTYPANAVAHTSTQHQTSQRLNDNNSDTVNAPLTEARPINEIAHTSTRHRLAFPNSDNSHRNVRLREVFPADDAAPTYVAIVEQAIISCRAVPTIRGTDTQKDANENIAGLIVATAMLIAFPMDARQCLRQDNLTLECDEIESITKTIENTMRVRHPVAGMETAYQNTENMKAIGAWMSDMEHRAQAGTWHFNASGELRGDPKKGLFRPLYESLDALGLLAADTRSLS